MTNIAGAFDNGVSQTTANDFCAKQIRAGVSAAVCNERFQMWQQRTRGKGQKMAANWANGKGNYGGSRGA